MDRTVPKTGSEEIELYIRTYYSLLRSSHAVQLDALVETHLTMGSSLHINAREARTRCFRPVLFDHASAFLHRRMSIWW